MNPHCTVLLDHQHTNCKILRRFDKSITNIMKYKDGQPFLRDKGNIGLVVNHISHKISIHTLPYSDIKFKRNEISDYYTSWKSTQINFKLYRKDYFTEKFNNLNKNPHTHK